jgi:cytochrome c553
VRAAVVAVVAAGLAGCERRAVPLSPPAAASAAAASAARAAVPAPAGLPTEAERELGALLAERGGTGFAACLGCHGPQGEGQAAAGFPRLGGQDFGYLWAQMEAYADGRRANPVMAPIAQAMSPTQRRASAAHYAALPPPTPPAAEPAAALDPEVLARGRQLAEHGDPALGVPACAGCHGADGRTGAAPRLAGQHAGYLVAALGAWKSGARRHGPGGDAARAAHELPEDDVRAAAAWFGSRR